MRRISLNFGPVLLLLYNQKQGHLCSSAFLSFVLWNVSRNLDFTEYFSSEHVHEMNTSKDPFGELFFV